MERRWSIGEMAIADVKAAERAIRSVGADPRGVAIMREKAVFRVIKLEKVPLRAANLLKQMFLSKGGDAAVSRGTAGLAVEATDMLLMGTLAQYRQVLALMHEQPFGLRSLASELEKFLWKK